MPPMQAGIMAEAFVFNLDNLVTTDYLEVCLDARFEEQDARMEVRFDQIEGKFRVIYWMLGLVIFTTLAPILRSFFGV